MTEWEWLHCNSPTHLLSAVHGQISERKRRLFAAACCRRLWGTSNESTMLALDAVDHFCEPARKTMSLDVRVVSAGQVALCAGASDPVEAFEIRHPDTLTEIVRREDIPNGLSCILEHFSCGRDNQNAGEWAGIAYMLARGGLSEADQSDILREVVRGPLRILDFRRAQWCDWEGGVIPAMAREAYAERDDSTGAMDAWRLAVIGDALEDAGCREDEFLDHLRSPGPHVRGCWVVDLLIGRG